jgi:3-oxoacyl-[acyl-carrier-protein] synthase II
MRVCVTGYGLIDALGNSPTENFARLIDFQSYSRPTEPLVADCKNTRAFYPEQNTEILPGNFDTRFFPRTMRYGMHAVYQAITHADVPITDNVGVFLSSLTGGNEYRYDMISSNRISPKKGINCTVDALCGFVSQYYGFKGINTCLYSACATGIVTIDYAMKFVDQYDYVIAGGADAGVNFIDMSLFSAFKALSDTSAPFDISRSGFVMGEGAGVVILESEEKAKARGAKIYGYIYPAGHASDAFNRTLPNGEGARHAMEQAIKYGGKPDVVNAHGTSTPGGDEVEYDAIIDVCGLLPIYSNKGKIGHTFAAAGVIETIYSIMSMNNQIIPHTQGCLVTKHAGIVMHPTKRLINKTLNNSFGFGGKCASMIVERGTI